MDVERSRPSEFQGANPDLLRSGPNESRDDWRVIWAFAAVLVGFKLVGLAIIAIYTLRAGIQDAFAFLAATHAPFIAAGLILLYWPLSTLYRRLRLRARRRRLIWSEWHVEETSSA